MNTITQDLEIWLICSTPWPTKKISKSLCSNASHNIYNQSKISPYISYGEALDMHVSFTALSWTCIGVQSHMSVIDAFIVIISHLVG